MTFCKVTLQTLFTNKNELFFRPWGVFADVGSACATGGRTKSRVQCLQFWRENVCTSFISPVIVLFTYPLQIYWLFSVFSQWRSVWSGALWSDPTHRTPDACGERTESQETPACLQCFCVWESAGPAARFWSILTCISVASVYLFIIDAILESMTIFMARKS